MEKQMKTALKATALAGVLMGAAILFFADPAEAAPNGSIDRMGDDSYFATCQVLKDRLDGRASDDVYTFAGVAEAIADHYGVSEDTAIRVELYQIKTYCPQFM